MLLRGTCDCLSTLKILQVIVVKRFKLVYVNRRDALMTGCKHDDVLHIQIRLHRLELKYNQKCYLNPTDDREVCNYI